MWSIFSVLFAGTCNLQLKSKPNLVVKSDSPLHLVRPVKWESSLVFRTCKKTYTPEGLDYLLSFLCRNCVVLHWHHQCLQRKVCPPLLCDMQNWLFLTTELASSSKFFCYCKQCCSNSFPGIYDKEVFCLFLFRNAGSEHVHIWGLQTTLSLSSTQFHSYKWCNDLDPVSFRISLIKNT